MTDHPQSPPSGAASGADTATADLIAFLTAARWFGGKGRAFEITGRQRVGALAALADEGADGGSVPDVAVDLVALRYLDADPVVGTQAEEALYQLPISCYAEAQEHLEHALIGVWDDEDLGVVHVYDAVHDRLAMARFLECFATPPVDAPLRFHRADAVETEFDPTTHATPFTGEQSNSSIRFGETALLKLFRRVTPGVNPDIEIHDVLTRAGSEHVAALYGWLDAEYAEADADDADAAGDDVLQLGMIQEFLTTASDGFELAKASVRNLYAEGDLRAEEVGGDFAAESARLGQALAEVHTALAEGFATADLHGADLEALVAAMHGRLGDAIAVVPELAAYAAPLAATFEALGALGSVAAQRVHGDLHLGQTLRTVTGWKIVDFEGEPAKSLAERRLPDSPWRDVAGMLRSFDYAPAVVDRAVAGADDVVDDADAQRRYRAREWSRRNRDAFTAAYAGRDLTDAEHVQLAAYEADKAVYEAVYESRNRPAWLPIPLAAIARLADAPSAPVSAAPSDEKEQS